MEHYQLTDARHGRFLVNVHDTFIGRCMRVFGEWSEAEIALFRQIVRPGDTVLEAGANIGTHTVFLSRQVGLAGHVIAVEPSRLTHQLLCANLALNECFNVRTLQAAMGETQGTVRFPAADPTRERNFGEMSIRMGATSTDTEEVAVTTIDALSLERLDFIKADIEGFEPQLLRGARETITRLRPVIYLEIDANVFPTGNRDELVGWLEPLGYSCHYYIAPMFNPDNFRGEKLDTIGAASLDMICVPCERATVEGLTRAAVGDNAIWIAPGQLGSTTLPWSAARFRYLESQPS